MCWLKLQISHRIPQIPTRGGAEWGFKFKVADPRLNQRANNLRLTALFVGAWFVNSCTSKVMVINLVSSGRDETFRHDSSRCNLQKIFFFFFFVQNQWLEFPGGCKELWCVPDFSQGRFTDVANARQQPLANLDTHSSRKTFSLTWLTAMLKGR